MSAACLVDELLDAPLALRRGYVSALVAVSHCLSHDEEDRTRRAVQEAFSDDMDADDEGAEDLSPRRSRALQCPNRGLMV